MEGSVTRNQGKRVSRMDRPRMMEEIHAPVRSVIQNSLMLVELHSINLYLPC